VSLHVVVIITAAAVWVPLGLKGALDGRRRLIVARIGGVCQPHVVEVLVHAAIDALTAGDGVAIDGLGGTIELS
jgi:hypothetical protein